MQIIEVNQKNLDKYPQVVCFINPKNEFHKIKLDWLKERFKEGLKIKLLFVQDQKGPAGFIEYVSGEFAWRGVTAKNYLFIHCIWTNPAKIRNKGYGKALIDEVVKDAEAQGKLGVAVMTSEGSFMVGKELFLKNGFKSVDSKKPSFELLVKNFKDVQNNELPKFNDVDKNLEKFQGLNIVYSNQCPWVSRFVKEVEKEKFGIDIKISEIKSAKDAQNAPSVYSVFNLIYNGKLISDHFISMTRFKNILQKELKI